MFYLDFSPLFVPSAEDPTSIYVITEKIRERYTPNNKRKKERREKMRERGRGKYLYLLLVLQKVWCAPLTSEVDKRYSYIPIIYSFSSSFFSFYYFYSLFSRLTFIEFVVPRRTSLPLICFSLSAGTKTSFKSVIFTTPTMNFGYSPRLLPLLPPSPLSLPSLSSPLSSLLSPSPPSPLPPHTFLIVRFRLLKRYPRNLLLTNSSKNSIETSECLRNMLLI